MGAVMKIGQKVLGRRSWVAGLVAAGLALGTTGCGTLATISKLEDGAGSEALKMWDTWVEAEGDIAIATTWVRKVKPGLTQKDIEEILSLVATEKNMREVGVLPLSKELEARTGTKQPLLIIYNYCSPTIARTMADFSPAMAAYMPCRISLVEQKDGLYLYTLNMDMMVKMGRKLPSPLKEQAQSVRDTIYEMMERASKGEF